jgi:hypothetical protein
VDKSKFISRCIVVNPTSDVIDGNYSSQACYLKDYTRNRTFFSIIKSSKDTFAIDINWSLDHIFINTANKSGSIFYIQVIVSFYDCFGKEYEFVSHKVYYKRHKFFHFVRRLDLEDHTLIRNLNGSGKKVGE